MRSGVAVSELPEKIEHFIGGRHVPSVSGRTFGVADPVSNRTRIAGVASATPASRALEPDR
jgi:5-carboxymethyl-2-hydroxymuconic-semialdehyde dehydrogenase